MKTKIDTSQSKAPAVERATKIIWNLSRHPEGQTLSAVSAELGVVPSSALHILRELVNSGLLVFNPHEKRYRLGPGVLTLSHRLTRSDEFVRLSQCLMSEVTRRFGVFAMSSELDHEDHIVVCAVSNAPKRIWPDAVPGKRLPGLASATGRVVAAFGVEGVATLKPRFDNVAWHRRPNFGNWLSEVEHTRRTGVAIDNGNFHGDLMILSAPILSSRAPAGRFVSLGLDRARATDDLRAELSVSIKNLARELSAAI